MKEILLACDVDNTLIHSWKHRKEGDLCIEYIVYRGKRAGIYEPYGSAALQLASE